MTNEPNLKAKITEDIYAAEPCRVRTPTDFVVLVDGMTAANDLGLIVAIPTHVAVHTDARGRSITFGNLTIEFKLTASSKLYWAVHPAMRIIQALHWLKDIIPSNEVRIISRLTVILNDPNYGLTIRKDLESGLKTLPAWMQWIVRKLLIEDDTARRGMKQSGRLKPEKVASIPSWKVAQ